MTIQERFRIHGDNIIECERMMDMILDQVSPTTVTHSLISSSVIVYDMRFSYGNQQYNWHLELLPGFTKRKKRWAMDIFSVLHANGSFLDETPDAIVTKVNGNDETILFAVEYCSALQAGNQAWQRIGRAYSTSRTGCPYFYVVDFGKYELDKNTRTRKNVRLPSPAVTYSFLHTSQAPNHFDAIIYVEAEEFQNPKDPVLKSFNSSDFAKVDFEKYIVKTMCGLNTATERHAIEQKEKNVLDFLAKQQNSNKQRMTQTQWRNLLNSQQDIVSYSVSNIKFSMKKIVANKSTHGKVKQFFSLVDQLSIGLIEASMPLGIIPANQRQDFGTKLQQLYPSFPQSDIRNISKSNSNLLICGMKGFKPKGDDDRPDRGLLPLLTMLSSETYEVLTYIYGPLTATAWKQLNSNWKGLASSNGLWQSILSLSNEVIIDSTVVKKASTTPSNSTISTGVTKIIDCSALKKSTLANTCTGTLTQPVFPSCPSSYHEDDVDTGIHYLFAHVLRKQFFEGLCNPPGGDWSGMSILCNNAQTEARWLALPRVTSSAKRPDHVIQYVSGHQSAPYLLLIESKEFSNDLEPNVGTGLKKYVKDLTKFGPSATRPYHSPNASWTININNNVVNNSCFSYVSAAAYLKTKSGKDATVFANSNCDMLFIMDPTPQGGWDIRLAAKTQQAKQLGNDLIQLVTSSSANRIISIHW